MSNKSGGVFMAHNDLYNVTGGVSQRDMAWMQIYPARGTDESGPGLVGGGGGPIDAPCYVPAGSVNCLEYYDFDGNPLAMSTQVWRG